MKNILQKMEFIHIFTLKVWNPFSGYKIFNIHLQKCSSTFQKTSVSMVMCCLESQMLKIFYVVILYFKGAIFTQRKYHGKL